MAKVDPQSKVVIVGAGCFGLSTAYHLLKRGYTDITVLERDHEVPAQDGSSNDFNRIVRSAYDDPFYTKLARDAIAAWKDGTWADAYHESGVLVLSVTGQSAYADLAVQNDIASGARVQLVTGEPALRGLFPEEVSTSSFEVYKNAGFLNLDGGWANAGQGIALLAEKVTSLGGKILKGKVVSELVKGEDGHTTGLRCEDGTSYAASLVVIASGAWTSSAFKEIAQKYPCGLATGQSVAMVQLTDEEKEIYNKCPVVLDFGSGFYIFPANEKGIVKLAMHLPGYTHKAGPDGISRPRTVVTDSSDGLRIPKSNVALFRTHLRNLYPKLAEKPFFATRLCWYNDTPDGNWLIGHVPEDPAIILATGGSGHAYKFTPVIGGLVADLIEGKMSEELKRKFAVDREYTSVDLTRSAMDAPKELDLKELCEAEDLLPR